ncbi:hypothetical protein LB506_002486 [Fusarium annulatum]|nr:hypothetical protein LB506_002486 [Fusarium annulatum]
MFVLFASSTLCGYVVLGDISTLQDHRWWIAILQLQITCGDAWAPEDRSPRVCVWSTQTGERRDALGDQLQGSVKYSTYSVHPYIHTPA